DFEANKRENVGIDWPIRYDDLAPWYDYVENYIGVSGSRENLPQLPDSAFQPPSQMNVAEKWVKERLEATSPGRKLINTRLSNMTEDKEDQGRSKCQFRNQCGRGCSFGAYFSTQAVTLPAARATGRLTLRPDSVVTSLDYDPTTRRVTGVRVVDANTKQAEVIPARLVFLCASAMASTQILMNSRIPGTGRSHFDTSGTLGRYVMDHIFRVGASGEIPGLTEYIEYGRRPSGVYIPRFRNHGGEEGVGFRRGYGYAGNASPDLAPPPPGRDPAATGWRAAPPVVDMTRPDQVAEVVVGAADPGAVPGVLADRAGHHLGLGPVAGGLFGAGAGLRATGQLLGGQQE